MANRQLLSRAERQEALLRAAATAFARAGFQATSMDDVAVEAAVTRLIVYRNFASKEELYRAVLERESHRLAERLDRAARNPGSGDVLTVMLAVAREDPDAFRLLWVHAQREPAFEAYAADFRLGAAAFAESLTADRLPAEARLRRWATDALVTTTVEAVLSWLDLGSPRLDEQFVAVARAGIVAMVEGWGSGPATS